MLKKVSNKGIAEDKQQQIHVRVLIIYGIGMIIEEGGRHIDEGCYNRVNNSTVLDDGYVNK